MGAAEDAEVDRSARILEGRMPEARKDEDGGGRETQWRGGI